MSRYRMKPHLGRLIFKEIDGSDEVTLTPHLGAWEGELNGGGITPTGTISITQNGTYDVTQYAEADVEVSGEMPEEYSIGGSLAQKDLTEYHFKSGITQIYDNMFHTCTKLETADIPDTVKKIGQGAFNSCSKYQTTKLPKSLEQMYSGAFYSCNKLDIKEMPVSVAKIPDACFAFTGIKNLTFLGNITEIGFRAFAWCASLSHLYFPNNTNVPTLSSTQNIPNNTIIVVPDSLYDDWVLATNWANYANNIVRESDYNA